MNQVSAAKRIKITLLLSIVFLVTLSYVASNEKTEAVASKAGLASDISIGHAQDNGRPQVAQAQAQSQTQKKTKVNPRSIGCVVCHTGSESMHMDGDDDLDIGCADCHGGNANETQDKKKAHVQPRNPDLFKSTANAERLNAL